MNIVENFPGNMFYDENLYKRRDANDFVSDMLEVLLKSARGPYSSGIIKAATYLMSGSLMVWILTEIIYFMFVLNAQFILDYALCMFMYIYATLIVLTNIAQKEQMNRLELLIKTDFWNISCCGQHLYDNFQKAARSYKILSWLQDLLGYANGIMLLPINTDRLDIIFFLMLLKKINTTVYKLYRFAYFPAQLWACRVAISYPNLYLYYVINLDMQYKLLMIHIQQINNCYEEYQSNKQKQLIIRRRMIFCITHYQKLKEFRKELYKLIFYPFFFIMWFGLGISMFMAYLLLVVEQRSNLLPLTLMWSTVAENAIFFSLVGQIYTDMADEFLNVLNSCEWYRWNVENRKIYLMFLMNAQRNKTLTGGGYAAMNLTFAIWIFRKTVSAFTFFKAVHRANTS